MLPAEVDANNDCNENCR